MIGRQRPRLPVAGLALAVTAMVVSGLVAACGGSIPVDVTAGPLPTPRSTPSTAVETTLVQLDAAIRAHGLALEPTLTTFRPAEPPSFAAVLRWPFQVVLPDDPAGGYFVIYEFPDVALAADGGRELAAYVTSGPGRVQFPPDVRFVLRQAGSTLVFYPWSPASSPDPRTPGAAAALASVGTEVPIPPG